MTAVDSVRAPGPLHELHLFPEMLAESATRLRRSRWIAGGRPCQYSARGAGLTGLEWLQRFELSLRRLKVVVERGTDDARQYLEWKAAEAVTFPLEAGYVVYFRDEAPTASAVLEELAHVLQSHRGRYTDSDLREMNARREIEAKACLDANGSRWGIPICEREVTRRQLSEERRRLEILLESWK